jgi:hypothetical protein
VSEGLYTVCLSACVSCYLLALQILPNGHQEKGDEEKKGLDQTDSGQKIAALENERQQLETELLKVCVLSFGMMLFDQRSTDLYYLTGETISRSC